MVPVWMIKLRPLRRPEDAYRSAAYWFTLFSGVGAALIGAFFFAGFAFLPPDPGKTRDHLGVTFGLVILVMGVLFFSAAVKPRRGRWVDPPPAIRVGDALALPIRRTARRLNIVALGGCAVTCVVTAFILDGTDRAVAGVGAVLFAGVVGFASSSDPTIRLSADGLTIPHWEPGEGYVPWEEIQAIAAVGNFHPHLAVTPRWSSKPITCTLHFQAWSPSAVLAALTYFDERKSARERLTDPDALERFRTWQA